MEKRICILYTGGTIGMVPSEKGYVPSSGAFLDLLRAIPDLYWADMPRWDVVEFDPLLDSSDITVREWNQIGRAIAARYDDYDGFVVLHGTDTMAYSASAISFMLENLSKPVIFTGSQIPLGQIRSDGRDNIISSLLIAASGQVHEVCIYFNGVLLRGNRSTKMSADHFNAFKSNNYPDLARIGLGIHFHEEALWRQRSQRPLKVQTAMDRNVMFIDLFPGITESTLRYLLNAPDVKGIVLKTYGAGNAPTDKWFVDLMRDAVKRGVVIVNVSQCVNGGVHSERYMTGNTLQSTGVVSGYDITSEAAITKLMYLFGMGLRSEQVKKYLNCSLCGEITI